METDAAEASVDGESLDVGATFFRHEELPSVSIRSAGIRLNCN